MKNKGMNRRQFISKSSLHATSIGCGMLMPGWVGQDEPARIGEEWRNSKEHLEAHLRPRGVVLQEARSNIERYWPHIDPIDDIADYVAMALRWTREENQNPIRIINDYGLIKEFNNLYSVKDQRKRYVQLVEALRQRDELPHAIGVQSHVGRWYEPDEVVRAYDELAKAGLPIHVTEYWARIQDAPFETEGIPEEELNEMLRQYLCDFYTVAFGHHAVEHITYWGNPFVDNEGLPTHMYEALFDLIQREWTTNLDMQSNADGLISLDAFYGDYLLKINGQSLRFSFTPRDNGLARLLTFDF